MRRCIVMALAMAALALVAWAQGDRQTQEQGLSPAAGPTSQPAGGAVAAALQHVRLDAKARQVIVDAKVCLREGDLEFLLCGGLNKAHESILSTDAQGWQLHAALLALGLTPGKPARWLQMPESEQGRFAPPQGAGLSIALRWKDESGKTRQADAAEWLTATGPNAAAAPKTWVFVGSEITTDRRYAADIEGAIISVANFVEAVIDVPFESSAENVSLSFKANTSAIPPLQTPVELIITALPDAEKAEHARLMLEVDRFGQVGFQGKRIAIEDLRLWARQYLARHAKGQVVLRVDGRALAWDIYNVRTQLRLGGLTAVEQEYVLPAEPVLPRSAKEAQESLKWWAEQFERANELIFDPAEEAQAVIAQVRRQLEETAALRQMWEEYGRNLGMLLRKYQATTQPAEKPAAGPAENF